MPKINHGAPVDWAFLADGVKNLDERLEALEKDRDDKAKPKEEGKVKS